MGKHHKGIGGKLLEAAEVAGIAGSFAYTKKTRNELKQQNRAASQQPYVDQTAPPQVYPTQPQYVQQYPPPQYTYQPPVQEPVRQPQTVNYTIQNHYYQTPLSEPPKYQTGFSDTSSVPVYPSAVQPRVEELNTSGYPNVPNMYSNNIVRYGAPKGGGIDAPP